VPRQTAGAVQRNRIRRLIREAIRFRKEEVQRVAGQARVGVDIVFQFHPASSLSLRRLSLHHIMPEVETIFGAIAERIARRKA
jgi:ribonuclease P protein component